MQEQWFTMHWSTGCTVVHVCLAGLVRAQILEEKLRYVSRFNYRIH